MCRTSSPSPFREVKVDAETGETRVSRWVGVFDIGRLIKAKTAASQMRGRIVMVWAWAWRWRRRRSSTRATGGS
ncbi:molybdopterin-dependent oxidoreductase [Streptomyces violaceus]|uniref:molybdopterin cofactor-binding domain-containing protein n=1 Tax=Streptomyces violaceus TaxID=1936 RepID=UPI002E24D012